MTIIYKNDTCKIKKLSSTYKFIFESGENFDNFYNKIKKNFIIENESKDKSFTIKAKKIESLSDLLKRKETLSYRHLKQLFLNIGKQLEGLESDGYCNIFLNIDDIVRVELDTKTQYGGSGTDIFFLYLNTKHFTPIKNNFTKILKPFNKNNKIISPEMKKVNSFPTEINITSQYYSLALLVCLCGEWQKKPKSFKINYSIDTFREYLSNIDNTKLYWALLRCLEINPTDRVYIYI
tara:strand:+ start:533 stop:1240 length:708 start_codon:yes stop_codon:yes gene_type:complete